MICFSDLHAEFWNDFQTRLEGGHTNRLNETLATLSIIFQTANAYKEHLFFLGDWYHRWASVDTVLGSIVTGHLYDLLDRYPTVEMWVLPGNHDLSDKRRTAYFTICSYQAHPRIHLVLASQLIDVEGMAIGAIPYTPDLDLVQTEAWEMANRSAGWIVAHTDLLGADAKIAGYHADRGISVDQFDRRLHGGTFGHYHLPQQLASSDERSWQYVGSPLQTSFEDEGQTKGVVRISRGPSGAIQQEFIPLPRTVEFQTITWTELKKWRRPGPFATQQLYLKIFLSLEEVEEAREYVADLTQQTNGNVQAILAPLAAKRQLHVVSPAQPTNPVRRWAESYSAPYDPTYMTELANYYLTES